MSKTNSEAKGIGERGQNLAIMIPNYNGAALIAETLRSLQAQGDVISEAQIEVVDNASTDDSERIVRETWGDRVIWTRNVENIGMVPNFNRCIERANRSWVHVLHSDDCVLPGAYEECQVCVDLFPRADVVFGRSVHMDGAGIWTGITRQLGPNTHGAMAYQPEFWALNPCEFAGVLFQKRAAERAGGFDPVNSFTSDWNLWWRMCRDGEFAVYSNRCIGAYRVFAGNATSALQKSGENLRQTVAQARRIYDADQNSIVNMRLFFRPVFECIVSQMDEYVASPSVTHKQRFAIRELPSGVIGVYERRRLLAFYVRQAREPAMARGGGTMNSKS